VNDYRHILAVGEELPALDGPNESQDEERGPSPAALSAKSPRAGRRAPGPAAGRFQMLNAFVDGAMAGLSRSELAAWVVLYRDTRDGVARASLADIARRGGMGRRTVARALQSLKRRGLLEVVRKGGLNQGASVYRVRVGVPGKSAGEEAAALVSPAAP
jgi:hypothetical protein